MSLEQEIEAAVGRVLDGEDLNDVFREFAKRVQQKQTRRVIYACSNCQAKNAICATCKAKEFVGDKLVSAAPFFLDKLKEAAGKPPAEPQEEEFEPEEGESF